MTFKVIVVGAGLAGCLLTNGLINHGVDAAVYERDEPGSKREGYQIRLGDAAISGFRQCLKERELNAILGKLGQNAGESATAPTIYTSRMRMLLDLSRIPSYSKSSAINRVVLRDILVQPLIEEGFANFGKAFSRYETIDGGEHAKRIRVHFADGTSEVGDILVGADGSASKVNYQLGARNLVEIKTHWSFLNKGELPPERIHELPDQLLKGPMIVFSKGASLYYALYLPPKADGHNSSTDLKYDEKAASFFWGLNIPVESLPYENISDIADRRQACLNYIRDWHPEFHIMLEIGASDEGASDLYAAKLRASDKPAKTWRSKARETLEEGGNTRVWLIGDAIHAMQPTRGMGGNQALLDCADLLPELLRMSAQAKDGQIPKDDEVEDACLRYERKMLDRSFEWVHKSGGSGMLSVNLDGFLGYLVYLIGAVVLPVVLVWYRAVGFFSK